MRAREAALMLAAAISAGCTQASSASAPTGTSGTTATPSATSTQSAQSSSAVTAGGRCQTSQLKISLGPMDGATGNELASVTMVNQASGSCYLGGYPGVELLDRNGNHLGDAARSLDSFFGTYPPPHRVDIAPGAGTTFDLTWSGIDPCGDGTPAWRPAHLKVTPPADYDSATISAVPPGMQYAPVCPNTMTVHPVGSKPQQG